MVAILRALGLATPVQVDQLFADRKGGDGKQVSPGSITVERGGLPMKTIISALIAASVIALATLPASALDAKTFFEQQSRQSN